MTAKAEFNAEEWSLLVGAPVLAAMRVITADRGGSVRETVALSRAYVAAREQHDGELMSALLATAPVADGPRRPRTSDDLASEAPEALRRAVAILERVATEEEVIEYERFVYALAETVARAHREGGFLGIGGTEISEHEQVALDEIAAVFDEPPGDAG